MQSLVQAKANNTAFSGNIDLARAILQQSDTTIGSAVTQCQRASQLAVQANTGTLSATDRAAIADQLDAIVGDLTALSQSKDPRGLPLFDASAAAIPVTDGIAVHANDDAARVFGTSIADIAAFAAVVRAGKPTATEGAAAIATFAAAATAATSAQASVGAKAARVELVASSSAAQADLVEQQRVAVEDTDMPTAVTELQRTMTVLQATQASFSKLSQLSLFDFLR